MVPEGVCSQRRMARPSAGKAERSNLRCRLTRRRFVLVSVSTTQLLTVAGFQP